MRNLVAANVTLNGAWRRLREVPANVDGPGNAVELEMCGEDLAKLRDGEQVEALNLVDPLANGSEAPVPDDLVAVVDDIESGNVRDGRSCQNRGNIRCLGGERADAELGGMLE